VTVLALIPARGGSKGVTRKNVRPLAGRPTIAWTIDAARGSARVDRVLVSTDDEEIRDTALALGAEAPFLRPPELAADDTGDRPVYDHALAWLAEQEGYAPEVVVWLRPTAPLRTAADVDGAVELLLRTGADCVRSVCAAEHHPYWMKRLEGDRLVPLLDADEAGYPRRQLLPPVYRLNGAVDAVRCAKVSEELWGGDVRGYEMPWERSVDLDDEVDFLLAELLLGRGL
jgi:CMP-N,N'-diacetyllegionaminic acid synthase